MSAYTDSRLNLHGSCKETDILSWQDAIGAAEEEIQKCERRIARLRNSIRLARQMIKKGEPFDVSTRNFEKKQ